MPANFIPDTPPPEYQSKENVSSFIYFICKKTCFRKYCPFMNHDPTSIYE